MPQPLFGVGFDAVAAQDAWGLGAPGFAGMNLDPAPGKGMNRDAHSQRRGGEILLPLSRWQCLDRAPAGAQADSAGDSGPFRQDVVLARANYAKLDEKNSAVRIRLNSTAVRVQASGRSRQRAGQSKSPMRAAARCTRCRPRIASWPAGTWSFPTSASSCRNSRKKRCRRRPKSHCSTPTSLIRNWKAFEKLGTNAIYVPGGYHSYMNLDLPVSIGGYECSQKPEEPIVVHMMKTPCKPGRPARDQHLMGRMELFTTTFETMERNIREQFARVVGPGGFDPATDITAITVNRWPHGYAYEYNSLWDKFWLEGGETPCEVARKPFGRIAIANADAGAYAYTDCAIDQAYRAVGEITKS